MNQTDISKVFVEMILIMYRIKHAWNQDIVLGSIEIYLNLKVALAPCCFLSSFCSSNYLLVVVCWETFIVQIFSHFGYPTNFAPSLVASRTNQRTYGIKTVRRVPLHSVLMYLLLIKPIGNQLLPIYKINSKRWHIVDKVQISTEIINTVKNNN